MIDANQYELITPGILRVGINLGNILLVTGSSESGVPEGVAPDMGRAFADWLGVEVKYVTFASPGEVADAATQEKWDVCLIAQEPRRAEVILFCDSYVEIEATYLVPNGSPFYSVNDLDKPGVDIAVSERSAYDLFLSRTLNYAVLHRAKGLSEAFQAFVDKELDALAGLVPALQENAKALPGSRLIPGCYTTVQQAIGTRLAKFALNGELDAFLKHAKSSGLIARLVKKHGVSGKIVVAS